MSDILLERAQIAHIAHWSGGRSAASVSRVREVELWRRMEEVLPQGYAHVWAHEVVLAKLGGRTVAEAIDAGVSCKKVWRAVWEFLELPEGWR